MSTPDPEAERRLAAAVAAGDRDAARALCEEYLPRLRAYVLRRSGLDDETALETAQETILAALRSVQVFRGESSLYTWLCAIARRKVADHYRRAGRRPLSLDGLIVAGLTLIDTEPLPEEVTEREEMAATIHSALWRLPEDQREAVFRKYLDDRSVAEIAAELGRSEKAVESLLSRGRANLRKRLTGKGDGAR
jgi:RNA polymerase sigma-70 factor (ECF subfamily)